MSVVVLVGGTPCSKELVENSGLEQELQLLKQTVSFWRQAALVHLYGLVNSINFAISDNTQ